MATTKHFALNDQEVNRTFIDIVADERTLREIYLPPFEAAVKLGNTAAVMSAFNAVNGDFASESKFLITEVLRQDWGFPGFVESDFLGIHNGVFAVLAGTDIDMPGFADDVPGVTDRRRMVVDARQNPPAEVLRPALANGEITEEDINNMVRRLLRTIISYDFIDNPPLSSPDPVAIADAAANSKKVAIKAEGIVLLENKSDTWDVAPGLYWILVGSSSQDIELRRPLVNLFPSSLSVLESSPVPGAKRLVELVSAGQAVRGKAAVPGTPALSVKDGSGDGQHTAGTIVKVTADEPPPRKTFAGWSGDTDILANPSERTTTATMPSIDVKVTRDLRRRRSIGRASRSGAATRALTFGDHSGYRERLALDRHDLANGMLTLRLPPSLSAQEET